MSGRGDNPSGMDQMPVAFIPTGDGYTDMVFVARQLRGSGGPRHDAAADWIERLAPVYLRAWKDPRTDSAARDDLMGQAVAMAVINHLLACLFPTLAERRAARTELTKIFSSNLFLLGADFERMAEADQPPSGGQDE